MTNNFSALRRNLLEIIGFSPVIIAGAAVANPVATQELDRVGQTDLPDLGATHHPDDDLDVCSHRDLDVDYSLQDLHDARELALERLRRNEEIA